MTDHFTAPMRPPLYFFNYPNAIGGAGTKVSHLLRLLHQDYAITMVPNRAESLADPSWRRFLAGLGVRALTWRQLPRKLSGWGLSLCNSRFFTEGQAARAKRRGLKIAWGSEMMWPHPGEVGSVLGGLVEVVLYTGAAQRAVLEPLYTCGGTAPAPRGVVVGNYIDPALYPFLERPARPVLTAGRVSRADPAKYPDDFPLAMHMPGIPGLHVRVLGWSDALTEKFAWYDFEKGKVRHRSAAMPWAGSGAVTWELLPPGAEDVTAFLHSLDYYHYDTGPGLSESWGRAVVEAMLTGLPVLIPADRRHHLHALVPDKVAGFHCTTPADWHAAVHSLTDPETRRRMAHAAADHARRVLCHADEHRAAWRTALR